MARSYALRAVALASALLCFGVGMLAGVEASTAPSADTVLVRSVTGPRTTIDRPAKTIAGPRMTVLRTVTAVETSTAPPVTVVHTVAAQVPRSGHHHRHHHGGGPGE
jgi:hypothetical protein